MLSLQFEAHEFCTNISFYDFHSNWEVWSMVWLLLPLHSTFPTIYVSCHFP